MKTSKTKYREAGYYDDGSGHKVWMPRQKRKTDMWGNPKPDDGRDNSFLRGSSSSSAAAYAKGGRNPRLVLNPDGNSYSYQQRGTDSGYGWGGGGGGAQDETFRAVPRGKAFGGRQTGYSAGLGAGYDSQYGAGGSTGYGDTLAGGAGGGFRTIGADGRARGSKGAFIRQAGQGGDGGLRGLRQGAGRSAIGFGVQRMQALGGLSRNTGGSGGAAAFGRFVGAAKRFR